MGYFCEDGKAEFDELQMNIGLGNISIIDDEIDSVKDAIMNEGIYYKNTDAYQQESTVCYIPELSPKVYTRETFMEIAKGIEWLAEFLFETVDWQHPSTLINEWEGDPEILGIKHYTEVYGSNETIKEITIPDRLSYKGMDFNKAVYWTWERNDDLFKKENIKSGFIYELIGKIFRRIKSDPECDEIEITEEFNVNNETLYISIVSKRANRKTRYFDEFYFKLVEDK